MEGYLERLASAQPTPGGGSAACIAGALGAALIAMVGRLTLASPKYGERSALLTELVARADAARAAFLEGARADEEAYGAVVAAQRLGRTTEDERLARAQALQRTLAHAAEVPLRNAEAALDVLRLAAQMSREGTPHAQSDVRCAQAFAHAAIAAALENVRVNHAYLKDAALVASQRERMQAVERAMLLLYDGTTVD